MIYDMNFILFVISIVIVLIYISLPRDIHESFFDTDQTRVPQDQPAGLSWNFESPKSNIKNFNETTYIHQGLNELQANTSNLIGLNQQIPLWIYPYTYLNRQFGHILLSLATQIEKDYNNNHMLEETDNTQWKKKYDYKLASWKFLPSDLQSYVVDIIAEINRRFNMTPPIVGFRKKIIKYYRINKKEVIIKVLIYKQYTPSDIRYQDDLLNPGINDDLKNNYEREILLYIDDIDGKGRYHLRFLRFPKIDYSKKNPIENMRYIKEFDDIFYLAKSKDPLYRMLNNTEVRGLYIDKVEEDRQKSLYKCFGKGYGGIKDLQQTNDQTSCELSDGTWEKQCQKDTDCPYFNANKNYPNKFGGCDKKTGYCQWPIDVKPFTYRKPLNPQEASCYNCVNGNLGRATIGKCCSDQKNKRIYLNLESPDYAFPNDIDDRFKHNKLFEKYNINWSKYT